MSASAIRRKSYKKAQEEAGAFAPIQWEGDHGRGVEVPAGKLQVMEKFFTPVQAGKERRGDPDLALRSNHQRWTASQSDRFSTFSSSSSTSASSASTSSASWSSEARFNKKAFPMASPHSRSRHSQSCVDISTEPSAFRRSRGREAAYKAADPPCSLARLRKGQSKSVERLPCGHQKTQSLPSQTNSIDRRLYKASGLERSLLFNEQAEILAPRQPHRMGVPGPGKGILKNGAEARGDRLRKAKSIETITVRSVEGESPAPPGPGGPLRREKQPPSSLDLSAPVKSPNAERRKRMEEKLRFSQFLNEITQQVLSPSSLCSLGWKPREAASASKTPSTDGSDSKGSSSKTSSPGSLLDVAEGKRKEEKASYERMLPMRPSAKGDAALGHSSRRQADPPPARSTDEASTSPEWGPAVPLTASLGSLPKPRGEVSGGQKKPGETKAGHGKDAEELPLKKAEDDASVVAEKPDTKDQQGNLAGKARICHQKLLEEMNIELPTSPREQPPTSSAKKDEEESKSGSGQRDLQKTWEELETLKEKFGRLQQDYSATQQTNQLLEEKLQNIAQSMAGERDILNQRINELMDRLAAAQNTICSLEKRKISGQQLKSGTEHQQAKKAESPDSFCSLHFLDVAPPPAFMDRTSDAHTTPSRPDSATETSKLAGTSRPDRAAPNGEEIPLLGYKARTPEPEVPDRHRRNNALTAFTPWKRKSTRFSVEPVNSTESECSGEEITPLCSLSTPRFLYLRQEALVAPSGPGSFPSLPRPEPVVFGLGCPASPSGLPSSRQLELGPEPSSSESSDGGEVSWCPGLMEKTSGSHLDYQAAQEMLDSLLHNSSERKKSQGREPSKIGRAEGFSLAGYKEGSGPGQISGHQHRVRYYPVEELPEGKSYPCPQHSRESLPRGVKGESVRLESFHAAQDSTSL